MASIKLQFDKVVGKIKPMHAVNNGPVSKKHSVRNNFDSFAALKIPYVRNHDASFSESYGSEHIVDVHAIFPDFNANPYDERSYDFQLTDEYTEAIVEAGAQVFYRFGSKIEHGSRKYGTIVPADFHKWAVVCEHIIRHYNEGWANGFHYNFLYWEIWNEPDGIGLNGNQPNWSGTPEEFYELYKVAATHLKQRFPHLKIGGPALSHPGAEKWAREFLEYLTRDGEKVPMDFFSWHKYETNANRLTELAFFIRGLLDEYGYTEAESILDEYNYMENWVDGFVPSFEVMISARGAAYTAAAMSVMQKAPLDMLMYYDARPCVFNGIFDFYTLRPLKGYYSLAMFSRLYELGNEVLSESDDDEVFVCAAADESAKAAMITYYSKDKAKKEEKEIEINLPDSAQWSCRLVDEDDTMTELAMKDYGDVVRITLKPNSVVIVESIVS